MPAVYRGSQKRREKEKKVKQESDDKSCALQGGVRSGKGLSALSWFLTSLEGGDKLAVCGDLNSPN